jgi:hypothetical protein
MNDNDLVLSALHRAIADARLLHKQDADADNPNLAPRAAWPSTDAFRAIFYRAARTLGPDAEPLLERIPDPEINIMARVMMAAAWLNAPTADIPVRVTR